MMICIFLLLVISSLCFGKIDKTSKLKENHSILSLNSNNYEEKVMNNSDICLVAFVDPQCKVCKKMFHELKAVSSQVDGVGVLVGIVDGTVEDDLVKLHGVEDFPTIKILRGKKTYTVARNEMNYDGPLEASHIVNAIFEVIEKDIPQLTGIAVFEEFCTGGSQVCVILGVPHILEASAEKRNKHLAVMAAASKVVRGMNFKFIWFEGSSQLELEDNLDMTFGFPAVSALSMDKGVYSICRSSYTVNNIKKFLTSLTMGGLQSFKIDRSPEIAFVEPWDGEDAIPYEEDPLDDDWSNEDL